jgi:hypothetical protein
MSSAEATPIEKIATVEGGQLRAGRVRIRKDKTNPRRIAYLILLLFASPPGWPLFAIGATLVIVAVLFHGWAAGYLTRAGYVEREKVLTARGPYRHTRNPYYAAHMLMDFGFFCAAGLPLLYLAYFPIIYAVYRNWVMNEEPFLEQEFGDDYRQFKREVPRWRIRITPAPARGHEQVFSWALFKLNNEFSRAGSHLFLLAIFTLYFFLGNPLVAVDPYARATLVGALACWLLQRDVYPLDVSRVYTGWLWLAAAITIFGTAFLVFAPVWERWSTASSWPAVVLGSAVGIAISLLSLPLVTRALGKELSDLISRPLSQWYVTGVGLGLLTLTLGGVWLALLTVLVLWAVRLAGVSTIAPIPRSTFMGLSLLTVFVIAAACAVMRLWS